MNALDFILLVNEWGNAYLITLAHDVQTNNFEPKGFSVFGVFNNDDVWYLEYNDSNSSDAKMFLELVGLPMNTKFKVVYGEIEYAY